MAGRLARFSISMDEELLLRLDRHLRRRGYTNRSEAFRDMARQILSEQQLKNPEVEGVAVLSIVYDHHRLDLPARLTDLQHKNIKNIVCTLHVHLDKHHCLEVLVMRGKAGDLQKTCNALVSLNGIKYGRVNLIVPKNLLP